MIIYIIALVQDMYNMGRNLKTGCIGAFIIDVNWNNVWAMSIAGQA